VFCPADKRIREEVGKKAAELLADEYKFHLDLPPVNDTSYNIVKRGNRWSGKGIHRNK
jgi:hypothetical protein